jgi:UDP-glucose 4-epimerase
LVTGGAGFIGSWIVDRLIGMNLPVVAIDNLTAGSPDNIPTNPLNKSLHFYTIDITNTNALRALFEQHPDIDIIFHNAATKKIVSTNDPRRDLDVNAKGTFNLLELALQHNVKKFIHASTGSVYGEPVTFPTTEKHPTNPRSYYGVSKLAAEKYVQVFNSEHGLNTTILRYHHVYGPRQPISGATGVIPIFISQLLRGEQPTIYGTGEQVRSFTFVQDVVKANIIVAERNESAGEIYNVASGTQTSISELFDALQELTGRVDIDPIYAPRQFGDIDIFDVDVEKIQRLGFECEVRLEDGLRQTIAWVEGVLKKERRNVD